MFTNEFEMDATITTILDETATHSDVQLIIGDDAVYIRQNEHDEAPPGDVIEMTPKMFSDMIAALELSEGLFVTKYKKT